MVRIGGQSEQNGVVLQGMINLNGWQMAKMKKSIPDMSLP